MSFKEINLEEGRPTVSEGRERLIRELTLARDEKVRAVKLIHGYGSSGTGGRLRVEVRRYLGLLKEQKRIVDFIPGEDYSIFDKTTRKLLDSEPHLRQDSDLNRYNNGITWVVLR